MAFNTYCTNRMPKFTMRGRNKDEENEEKDNEKKKTTSTKSLPGPQTYTAKTFNEKGKYILSNYTNNGTVNWANLKSKRFVYESKE